MYNLGDLVVRLRADATQFDKTLTLAAAKLDATGRNMQSIGRSMTTYMTLPLLALGTATIKTFSNFDQAMTKSVSILGNVSDSMRNSMEKTARSLSKESKFSAKELAESYYFLASAGYSAAEALSLLGTINTFAVAGIFKMSQATTLLADAQSALGMRSKNLVENQKNMVRISDVLVKANTLANATVEQFSRALTNKAASSLKVLNKDVEEGVAVLAAYAQQGVKANKAGQFLYMMSRDLQKAAINNHAVWKRFGLTVYDNTGKIRNYADIIQQLENRLSSMSDKEARTTLQMLGFQDRGLAATQMLLGMSSEIRRFEQELRKAGGTTQKVADEQLKSFHNQVLMTWHAVQDLAITIGERLAPTILKMNKGIEETINFFNSLSPGLQNIILNITSIIGVVLALSGVFGLFGGVLIRALGVLLKFEAGLLRILTLPFSLLLSPWLLVGALIGGVIILLVGPGGFSKAWKTITEAGKSFFQFMNGFMNNFVENIKILGTWLSEFFTNIFLDLKDMLSNIFNEMIKEIIDFIVAIKSIPEKIRNRIKEDYDRVAFAEARSGLEYNAQSRGFANEQQMKQFDQLIAQGHNREEAWAIISGRASSTINKVPFIDQGKPGFDRTSMMEAPKFNLKIDESEFDGIQDFIDKTYKNMYENTDSENKKSFMEKFNDAMEGIQDKFSDFNSGFNDMENGFGAIINKMGDFRQIGLNVARDVTSGMKSAFSGLIKDLFDGTKSIEDAFIAMGERILDAFIDIVADIMAQLAIVGIVKLGTSLLSGISFGKGVKATSSGSGLGSANFDFSDVPLMMADGGIVSRSNSSYGVMSQPTVVTGEGRYNEAYVPLPNGSSIPVEIRNREEDEGGNKGVVVNYTQVVSAWDASDVMRNIKTITNAFTNEILSNKSLRGVIKNV